MSKAQLRLAAPGWLALCAVLPLLSCGGRATVVDDAEHQASESLSGEYRKGDEGPRGALRLVFGGDVMFGRWRGEEYRPHGGETPFAELRGVLSGADYALVNLESGLCDSVRPGPAEVVRLTAPRSRAEEMAAAGIDVVSLANNHALDCGADSLETTIAVLSDAGIEVTGARQRDAPLPVLEVSRDGVEMLIVAVTDRLARTTGERASGFVPAWISTQKLEAELVPLVSELRVSHPSHVVVVSLHWGHELLAVPTRTQQRIARAVADAGANLVVAHHAHRLQSLEVHGTSLIAYGLGNLVFDMHDPLTHEVGLLDLQLEKSDEGWTVARAQIHPFMWDGTRRGPRAVACEAVEEGAFSSLSGSADAARFECEEGVFVLVRDTER